MSGDTLAAFIDARNASSARDGDPNVKKDSQAIKASTSVTRHKWHDIC